MEITSPFPVSEVPVYVVVLVFGGFSRGFCSWFDQWVEFHSCHVRSDVLSYCTLELQEIRQQQLFLSQPATQHIPQQFVPVHAVTFYFYRGHMQPRFSRLGAQLCTTSKTHWQKIS